MARSSQAARYGALAERKAAEHYRLQFSLEDEQGREHGVHTSWRDAVAPDGTPHEIKACDLGRDYPRFRIFEQPHDELQRRDGRYVFVAYRRRGRGITVVEMTRVHASRLPGRTWYGAGGHRDSRQRKLPVSTIFG